MKWFQKILVLITLFFIVQIGFGQTNKGNSPTEHSPKKATIYSAVLPGLGQFYNKKYWKIPIIYGGMGAFTYLAIQNQSEFNRYKTAILQREAGEVDEFTDVNGNEIYNETALLNYMDKYRKNRDLNIIGVAVVYAIQIVDANVDANLFDFDIGDELSIRVFPQTLNNYYTRTPVTGIGCTINF